MKLINVFIAARAYDECSSCCAITIRRQTGHVLLYEVIISIYIHQKIVPDTHSAHTFDEMMMMYILRAYVKQHFQVTILIPNQNTRHPNKNSIIVFHVLRFCPYHLCVFLDVAMIVQSEWFTITTRPCHFVNKYCTFFLTI